MFKLALCLATAFILTGWLWGTTAVLLTAVLTMALLTAWGYQHWGYARVPELQVGVVYNTRRQSFDRFLPPGRHHLMPFVEQLQATIPLTTGSAADRTHGLLTSGGIALDMDWTVQYTLNPFRIPADKQAKAARTLPTKATAVASKQMHNCLQHVVGEYTIDQLTQPGIHKRLEREVRQLLAERLAEGGFELSRVMIGAIEMPPHVRTALESAQERRVQTENEAQALSRLHQIVTQFSDADMQRLIELERIHALGQHGVALFYPATAVPEPSSDGPTQATRFVAKRRLAAAAVS